METQHHMQSLGNWSESTLETTQLVGKVGIQTDGPYMPAMQCHAVHRVSLKSNSTSAGFRETLAVPWEPQV
ncbi:hypothetical protein P7K49_014891 [Saguinus oedipus]|uniref:Uncharacterized protein n=1 Tax=Saguinus oedipus TaxID=9490 RepID=A0ABQ9V7N4_SAGOE|nr:hypothetical protein P7K49_014891 [Saguinus oedipus]